METVVKNRRGEWKTITVGRAPDNAIVLDAGQVSGHHAQFLIDDAQNLHIEDFGSTNGTYINSERIPVNIRKPVCVSDSLHFGSFQFDLQQLQPHIVFPESHAGQNRRATTVSGSATEKAGAPVSHGNMTGEAPSPAGPPSFSGATQFYDPSEGAADFSERIALDKTKDLISVGRSPGNDIVLGIPQVSAHHALLRRSGNGYIVNDLKSTNGTFVNGKRIESCLVKDGDCIQLGSVKLEFYQDGIQKYDQSQNVRLDVFNVVQQSQSKIYLNETSLSILPNEFVGLLAPSAAGKTTLLETILGIRKPSSGKVLVNNLDLYEHFDSFRQWIGYVPQDDIIHNELTVRQCLYFSARLRLALDADEINHRIDNILEDLEISHVQNTQIGGRKERISGGQRKRVSLGVELLAEPGLLFLDEPTSGLDPRTERVMMKLFRKLSDQGRTIIVITHSMESLDQLDNIVFLSAGGFLSYYGPASECYAYFDEKNPADIFNHLQASDARDRNEEYKRSAYYSEYIEKRLITANPHKSEPSENAKQANTRLINYKQTAILTKRNFTIKSKDIRNTLMLLAQAPIIAFLLTIGFDTLSDALLLIISISAIFFGCINSCREIVGELSIYKRERMLNLNLCAYILSKMLVFSLFCFAQGIMFLAIIYGYIDMGNRSPLTLFALFFLTAFAGVTLGLLVSAISDTQEKAMTIVPIVLLPQIIFAGGLFPLSGVSQVISYFTISRWSLEAFRDIEVYHNCFFIALITMIFLVSTYLVMRRYDTNSQWRFKLKTKIFNRNRPVEESSV
ncbi:hypothetical protein DSCO28_21980 [Desulfosarcina ovata subsp. sediminis]|uniref:ABC transporter ATP-binding protein n=1 Tax=Desulfosarcina ovata subsp. sediminis TaxID=885957 RepID=A0A5K7ZHP7_9BACT|nr:FHA domain-containing protein [Desulfosarcina ovata]BBO81632.1 hypothetical protein DSCO28_21980 [Desulfosarcina ovata subsp. sediminis]